MSDDAFIDAILAAPDDDGPRLVYADVLIERGDPRGEYIVVQCERARLERAGLRGTRAHHDLVVREREISTAYVKSWVDPIGLTRWWGDFERGFITHLSIKPNGLRTRWDVFSRQPLESLRLRLLPHGTLGDLAWVARNATSPKKISIDCRHGTAVFDAAPMKTALATHDVSADDIDAWPYGAFVDPVLQPAIIELQLTFPTADDLDLATHLPSLQHLNLHHLAAATPAQMRALVLRLENRPTESLWASFCPAAAAMAFLGEQPPPTLRTLGLSNEYRSTFPAAVSRAFAESAFLPQLETLQGDLAADPFLARALDERAVALKQMTLERLPTETRAIDAIFAGIGCRLEGLTIVGHDQELPASVLQLTNLRTLSLDRFTLGPGLARAMVAGLPKLNVLDIYGGKISAGVPEILRERWPSAQIAAVQ